MTNPDRQERCGEVDNDNPYLECALPLGHSGVHSDRANPNQQERCPTCKSEQRNKSPHYVGAIPYRATPGNPPNCPDPWHKERIDVQDVQRLTNPDQQERDCPTCGSDRDDADFGQAGRCPDPFHDPDQRSPGERLYHEWCESSETDQARYWHLMNPAHKRRWERLAADPEQEVKRLRDSLSESYDREAGYQKWITDLADEREATEQEVKRLREAIKRHRHANVVIGREQPPEIDRTLYAALEDK